MCKVRWLYSDFNFHYTLSAWCAKSDDCIQILIFVTLFTLKSNDKIGGDGWEITIKQQVILLIIYHRNIIYFFDTTDSLLRQPASPMVGVKPWRGVKEERLTPSQLTSLQFLWLDVTLYQSHSRCHWRERVWNKGWYRVSPFSFNWCDWELHARQTSTQSASLTQLV